MATGSPRFIDPEIINLSGELFDRVHVYAPADEVVPDRITLSSVGQCARLAERRATSARGGSWAVRVSAFVLAIGGVAAARQMGPLARDAWGSLQVAPVAALVHSPEMASQGALPAAPTPPDAAPAIMATSPTKQAVPAPTTESPRPPVTRSPQLSATPPSDLHFASYTSAPGGLAELAALPAFTPTAAIVAIAAAARGTGRCTGPDGPAATMHARITFAPSGSVTAVALTDGPFVGSATGSCIAGVLRGATVRPFSGPTGVVQTTIGIR